MYIVIGIGKKFIYDYCHLKKKNAGQIHYSTAGNPGFLVWKMLK